MQTNGIERLSRELQFATGVRELCDLVRCVCGQVGRCDVRWTMRMII